MKTTSWVFLVGVSTLTTLFETSFSTSTFFPLSAVRPLFPMFVILLLLNRRMASYFSAGISGFVFDMFSSSPTGFAFGRWLLLILIADYVLRLVITNRSLYGAIFLAVSIRLIDRILLYGISGLYLLISGKFVFIESWFNLMFILVMDCIVTAGVFLAFSLFTRRFMSSV